MVGVVLVLVYFGAALLAAAIVLQPDRFTVARSAIVNAPPNVVFRHVNELRKWEAWSPWAKLDPRARRVYSGPEAGVGAAFEWSGDKKSGAGRMTIVESEPDKSINIKLETRKPFRAVNDVFFDLEPEDGGAAASAARTKVIWTMSGRNNLVAKAMNLLMNCEKKLGGQLEEGLDNLNSALAG
jgi:hypothetical protein